MLMDERIRSACFECDWHLSGGDKNDPRCTLHCDKRMGPVMVIGAMVSSMDPVIKKMAPRDKVEQKKIVLEKSATKSEQRRSQLVPEFKVCKKPDCSHEGARQPIGSFRYNTKAQRNIDICNTCIGQRISDAHKKRKKEKQPEPQNNYKVEIDFSKNEDVYKSLVELATTKLRTIENQALWIFIKIHEKGKEIE